MDCRLNIYYRAFLNQRNRHLIPYSWTYDKFCQILNERNGIIYVNDNDFHIRYKPTPNFLDNDNNEDYYHYDGIVANAFKWMIENNCTHCCNLDEFKRFLNESNSSVGYSRNGRYSFHCDYDTDDEFDDETPHYSIKTLESTQFTKYEKPSLLATTTN